MEQEVKQLQVELDIMLAVEVLEYNDKNYLSGNNKSRSEERQSQISRCMNLTKEIQRRLAVLNDRPCVNTTPNGVLAPLQGMDTGRLRQG